MSVECEKKCCANCAHCYETKEGGSYGCTQNVFKPGDLLDDEIHGEFQDGDTTCTCWAPDEENEDAPETVHDVFHTPSGLLPLLNPPYATPGAKGKKDRQVTCVKLPLLAVSKELGSPRKDGTRAVYGVSCVSDGDGHATVKLYVDGVRVGTAFLDVGHTTAWAIDKQMKYYLISRKEKAMRHRANVRARREGGAV